MKLIKSGNWWFDEEGRPRITTPTHQIAEVVVDEDVLDQLEDYDELYRLAESIVYVFDRYPSAQFALRGLNDSARTLLHRIKSKAVSA